jgi:moderate conductance mechanosensitive channel
MRRMLKGPLWGLVLLLGVMVGAGAARVQSAPPPGLPPGQVQQKPRAVAPAEAPATTSGLLIQRIAGLEQHLAALAEAVPRLPDEFRSAHLRLLAELQGRGGFAVFVLVAGFLALGRT